MSDLNSIYSNHAEAINTYQNKLQMNLMKEEGKQREEEGLAVPLGIEAIRHALDTNTMRSLGGHFINKFGAKGIAEAYKKGGVSGVLDHAQTQIRENGIGVLPDHIAAAVKKGTDTLQAHAAAGRNSALELAEGIQNSMNQAVDGVGAAVQKVAANAQDAVAQTKGRAIAAVEDAEQKGAAAVAEGGASARGVVGHSQQTAVDAAKAADAAKVKADALISNAASKKEAPAAAAEPTPAGEPARIQLPELEGSINPGSRIARGSARLRPMGGRAGRGVSRALPSRATPELIAQAQAQMDANRAKRMSAPNMVADSQRRAAAEPMGLPPRSAYSRAALFGPNAEANAAARSEAATVARMPRSSVPAKDIWKAGAFEEVGEFE